jgi:hypothetical protein
MNPLRLVFAVLLLCLVGVWSCQRHADLAGSYAAANPADKERTVLLVIRPDGNGWWTVDGEELPFRWEQRSREIWLHAKSGGMIAGKLADGSGITMNLPGVGDLSFRKTSP